MAPARALVINLLVMLVFTSAPIRLAHGCGISIVNKCSYNVTTCVQGGTDPIMISQYEIGAGASEYLNFGTACSWSAGVIWRSVTGQCPNPSGPTSTVDMNLSNLAEFTIGGGTDYYDLSNINAYTIGLGISVTNSQGGECTSIECSISDISTFCQGDNRLVEEPSGALSCINTDGGDGLGPTTNTNYFHEACPEAYSYSNDNETLTITCNTGSDYQVTFCP